MSDSLCQRFAQIIGGTVSDSINNSCTVSRKRENLMVSIMGRPMHSMLEASLSFQSVDAQGRTLNLGEVPLLEEEANSFIASLQNGNITVSALHNHWLFDQPRIMYVHFESIENPLLFAQKVADAFKVLK